MRTTKGLRILAALLCAGAVQAADATVTVLETHMTLLNVVNGSGNEIVETAAGAAALGPGKIVGVYPVLRGATTEARGFILTNPVGPPVPAKVPAPMIASGSLTWVQPYDVNSSGIYVGQARGSNPSGLLYAATGAGAFGGLDNSALWAGSAALSINNQGVIVGWRQPKNASGQAGPEQAFYYTGTGAVRDITIPGAASSRAMSVNTPLPGQHTLVSGFYRLATGNGNPRGFVYDIDEIDPSKAFKDLGRVVIPTIQPFDPGHYVSINADGVVVATRPVPVDSLTTYEAFVLDGQGHTTSIHPFGRYEDTFATGISDSGWVVGVLRDREGADSGFLWVAGQTIDLSQYAMTDGWTGITWALDAYSSPIDANGRQTGTIVGVGKFVENGVSKQRAFAMQITTQVPEPQTYLMLGLGLLAIGALRMRGLGRP